MAVENLLQRCTHKHGQRLKHTETKMSEADDGGVRFSPWAPNSLATKKLIRFSFPFSWLDTERPGAD